jgi:bacillolysin
MLLHLSFHLRAECELVVKLGHMNPINISVTAMLVLVACFRGIAAAGDDDAVAAVRVAMARQQGIAANINTNVAVPAGQDTGASAVADRLRSAIRQFHGGRPVSGQLATGGRVLTMVEPVNGPSQAVLAAQGAEVHLRSENQTVLQIKGGALERRPRMGALAVGDDPEEDIARSFLRRHRELLRLEDPDAELVLVRRKRDELGHTHLRFEQQHRGLPVWPASLNVHLDAAGTANLIEGAYVPTPQVAELTPLISVADAIARARASVGAGMASETSQPELMIYAPLDGMPRLAWKLELNLGLSHAWSFVVDAMNGAILHRADGILDANVHGTGSDLEGFMRPLNVWQDGDMYYLADTTKSSFDPNFDPIQSPRGVITIGDARDVPIDQLRTFFTVSSTSPNAWPHGDGVSAAYNLSLTYDYFLDRHGRNSLDGEGGNITAVVRVGDYNNASWHGNLKLMFFGTVRRFAAALDIVGHELTHGVTENSAGLIYENQSGALNEAFSDIFGEMVEARALGQNDWLVGSQLAAPLRNMRNPGALTIPGLGRPYPSRMSEFVELPNTRDTDNGGVHFNSSIINHAFYLLAEGLEGALGLRDAERIFYRCLTFHLQAQSRFIDCRLGCIAAAEALFGAGSREALKTAEAFDAVEIFATPGTPPPTPVPTVPGPDSTLFVYFDLAHLDFALGRRETAQGDPGVGSEFIFNVRPTRPAVTGDGSLVVFVDAAYDLCVAATDDSSTLTCLGFAGQVHSAAISPDGTYGAFVLRNPATGQPDNQIVVVNVATGEARIHRLVAPSVDGAAIDAVLHADSMTFSTDGTKVIYDAVSEVRFGNSPIAARWSLYALDLATEQTTIIVPPIDGIDTGNPAMGRMGNRYLTFDARVAATGNAVIIALDLFTGNLGGVGVAAGGYGFPAFTGDESAIVYAAADATAPLTGFSLVRQELTLDRLGSQGEPTLWYSDAVLGVLYRRGGFSGTNALPTVRLTVNPAEPTAPANLELMAEAADADGAIARVEFYKGSERLGEATTAPYTFGWDNVAAGNHLFVARAIDNLGGARDSSPVFVTVRPAGGTQPRLRIAALGDPAVRLTLTGTPGDYIIEQSADLRTWSDIYPVTIDGSGTASLEDTGGPQNMPTLFYRARKH